MLIIQQDEVKIISAPITQAEEALLPLTHESGAAYWVIDAEHGEPFTDSTGTVYLLRKRTEVELADDPLYIVWQTAQAMQAASAAAKALFESGAVPAWLKTFDTGDVEAYIKANVVDLASAKVALTHIGKAIILFRDYIKIRG